MESGGTIDGDEELIDTSHDKAWAQTASNFYKPLDTSSGKSPKKLKDESDLKSSDGELSDTGQCSDWIFLSDFKFLVDLSSS